MPFQRDSTLHFTVWLLFWLCRPRWDLFEFSLSVRIATNWFTECPFVRDRECMPCAVHRVVYIHTFYFFESLNFWIYDFQNLLSFMLVSDLFVVRALFSNLFHTASLSTFYSFSFLFDLSVAVAVSGCHAIRRYYRSWWWHCRWRQQIPGMAYKMEQQSTRLFSSIFHLFVPPSFLSQSRSRVLPQR